MEPSKTGFDLSAFNEALRQASMAAQNAIRALNGMDIQKAIRAINQRDLIALIEKRRDDERWRNDPLQIKARFLDPIPTGIADTLRAIAFLIDP